MSRKIKIIVTLSLILNIVFAGLILGFFYRMPPQKMLRSDAVEKLSPAGQDLFNARMSALRKDMHESFKEIKDIRVRVQALLEEENFDADAYNSAVAHMAVVQERILTIRSRALQELAISLEDNDRREIAAFLAAPYPQGHKGSKKGGGEERKHVGPRD